MPNLENDIQQFAHKEYMCDYRGLFIERVSDIFAAKRREREGRRNRMIVSGGVLLSRHAEGSEESCGLP
ncbi:hypothetical protein, partial [Microtetraspora glauca]